MTGLVNSAHLCSTHPPPHYPQSMVDTAFSSSMYVYQGARKPPHAMVKSTMKGHSTTPGAEGKDLKKQTQMLNEFFFLYCSVLI